MPPSPSLVSSLGALTILVVEFTTTWNRLPQARLAQRGLEQQRRGSSAEGNHLSRVSHHASPLAWKSVPALTLANIFYCEKLVGSPALALEGCEAPTRAPCCRWLTTGTHCLFSLAQRTCLCGTGGRWHLRKGVCVTSFVIQFPFAHAFVMLVCCARSSTSTSTCPSVRARASFTVSPQDVCRHT